MNEELLSKIKSGMQPEEFEALSEPINHDLLAALYADNKILDTYNAMPDQFKNAVPFKDYWEYYRDSIGEETGDDDEPSE